MDRMKESTRDFSSGLRVLSWFQRQGRICKRKYLKTHSHVHKHLFSGFSVVHVLFTPAHTLELEFAPPLCVCTLAPLLKLFSHFNFSWFRPQSGTQKWSGQGTPAHGLPGLSLLHAQFTPTHTLKMECGLPSCVCTLAALLKLFSHFNFSWLRSQSGTQKWSGQRTPAQGPSALHGRIRERLRWLEWRLFWRTACFSYSIIKYLLCVKQDVCANHQPFSAMLVWVRHWTGRECRQETSSSGY